MILPALILFVAFNTIPLITGAFYSFTNYRGYGSYDFVGLRNYIDLFQDARVGQSYLFTFKYARGNGAGKSYFSVSCYGSEQQDQS